MESDIDEAIALRAQHLDGMEAATEVARANVATLARLADIEHEKLAMAKDEYAANQDANENARKFYREIAERNARSYERIAAALEAFVRGPR